MLEEGKNKVLPCGRNSVGALDPALSYIPFGVCAFRFPRQLQVLFRKALRIFERGIIVLLLSNQVSQTITRTNPER